MNIEILQKSKMLSNRLCELGRVAVAFSGGVDSTYLLYAAVQALGAQNVVALTADSPLIPREDIKRAKTLAASIGVVSRMLMFDALALPEVVANDSLRCYHCKKAVFSALRKEAKAHGFFHLLDGSNTDDDKDYRPGKQATLELGVLSPLRDAKLTKAEIRQLSREAQLPTSNLPAYACLATRVQTGTPLDAATLKRIEKAERALHEMGVLDVRVRAHGDVARIELPQDKLANAIDRRSDIINAIRTAGFRFASLDLEGYRMGSSNTEIKHGQ